MSQKLQAFAETVARDIEQENQVAIPFSEIIAMIKEIMAAFPCFKQQTSQSTVEWIKDHPRTARHYGIREIKKSEGVRRRVAKELYDRSLDNALSLGDEGFVELITEAKAVN